MYFCHTPVVFLSYFPCTPHLLPRTSHILPCTLHVLPIYSHLLPLYFPSTPTDSLLLPVYSHCTSHLLPSTPYLLPVYFPSTPYLLPLYSHLLPFYSLILLKYFGVYEVSLLPPCSHCMKGGFRVTLPRGENSLLYGTPLSIRKNRIFR